MQYSKSHFLFIVLSIGITMSVYLVAFHLSDFERSNIELSDAQSTVNSIVLYNGIQKNENTVGSMASLKKAFSLSGISNTISENTFINSANAAIELDDETLQGERPLLNVFLSGTNTDAGYVIQLKKSFIFKIEESLKNDPF